MHTFDQDLPDSAIPNPQEDTPEVNTAPEATKTPETEESPEARKENTMASSGFFTATLTGEPVPPAPAPVVPPAPVLSATETAVEPVAAKPARPKKVRKKEKKTVSLAAFVAVILVFCLLIGCCFGAMYQMNRYWEKQLDDAVAEAKEDLIAGMVYVMEKIPVEDSTSAAGVNLAPSQVYSQNVNAVVSVYCEVTGMFGMTGYSSGSGFIYSQDGYILTNAHVVEDAVSISVTTYTGEEHTATLIGADTLLDVAVLKIEGEGYPYVTMGKSSDVIVGEQVAAIGNPLGSLAFSMTVGYVSAKDRVVTTEGTTTNMIQTDVAINSGNSGGPLFNMAGQVIGITSAKYSGTSSSGATIEGISFSIPIDDVQAVLPELLTNGYTSYAYLGVKVSDAYDCNTPIGATVAELFDDFTAQKSGIQVNDIITQVDQHQISNVSTLTLALRNYKPGDTVNITVMRGEETLTISVVLDQRPLE